MRVQALVVSGHLGTLATSARGGLGMKEAVLPLCLSKDTTWDLSPALMLLSPFLSSELCVKGDHR